MHRGNRSIYDGAAWILTRAVAALILLLSPGCAYIGAAVALAVGGGSDGGGGTAVPVEPVAILGMVGPRVVGTVQVDYQLQDANSDLVDVEVEVSADGGASFGPATITNPDAGTLNGNVVTGVGATGTLASHSFDWDSVADLGAAAVPTVQLRITPTDAAGLVGMESVSATFTTGNDAPEVEIASLGATSGIVPMQVTLYDSTSDSCDLQVEYAYSTDGGTTFTPLSPATILFPNPLGVTSDPRSLGKVHTFAWDSVTDVGTLNALARLQVTPDDSLDVGLPVVSNDFGISNNDAPAAFINEVGRQDRIVQVDFILVDPQQDSVDVVFDYTLDPVDPPDPLSFSPVTIDSGSTTGLPSDGSTQTVNWDSQADLGTSAVSGVRLRITPSDVGGSGTAYLSSFFVVGNDAPSISVRDMSGEIHEGQVTLNFDLIDTTGDFCDITVVYSTGGPFQPATIAVGGTQNLSSAPGAGQNHTISWATLTDLGVANEPNVVVQITPCDDPTGSNPKCGAAGTTFMFTVNNSEAPAAYVAFPLTGDVVGGSAPITYLLFQADGLAVNLTVEYSTDGGSTWSGATEGAGSDGTTNLAASPGGTTHLFVWETATDLLATQDYPAALLRLTPDLGGTGVPHVSGSFLVNNNAEPVAFLGTPASPQTLGDVAIDYTLQDGEADAVEITVEYSTDGGTTFATATDAGAGVGSEGTVGLSSSAGGLAHTFVWDSIADGVALNAQEAGVIFRITPTDDPASPELGAGPVARTIAFTVDNTDEPVVEIDPVANQSGNVVVTYTLTDDESSALDLVVEYSTDGGSTYRSAKECTVCTSPASDGVTGLSSSPLGDPHTFVWESGTDLGPALLVGVLFRLTPSDTKTGLSAVSNAFTVNNNQAPIALIQTPGGIPSGDVVIPYSLSDNNGDVSLIVTEFSTDGGTTFNAATEQPGLPSEGTSGLATSPAGVNHIYVWDSAAVADLGLSFVPSVVFRLTPQDTTLGASADTGAFPVNNQELLPVARIDPVSRSLLADVTITYLLSDGDSDLADIDVEYSTDGGTTWGSCTDAGGTSEGKASLVTSPGGVAHTFVWDSATDLPAGAQAGITIRITPFDGDGTGFGDVSNTFIRGNDAPGITLTSPAPLSTESGLVEFVFTLSDSTSDTVDLTLEYSTDSGSTFPTATISVGGVSSLYAPPGGAVHNVAWNSVADVGVANLTGVLFRITPTDSLLATGVSDSVTIDIANNDLPITFIGSPSGGDLKGGNVSVSYILIDGNSDTIAVDVEVSTDGGVTFAGATLANTDEGTITLSQIAGLSSSQGGVGHSFDWVSGTDVASIDTDQAVMRITPSDPLNTGNPFTTASFLVNNNAEPDAVVPTPGGVQVGNVTLTYTLLDVEGDLVDIDLFFSTDSGQTFAAATEVAGPPSEGVTGLTASPVGDLHTFVWDTVADAVAIAASENDVILRVVPRDNPNLALGQGSAGQTDILTVDNTTAPTVTIAAVPSPQTGAATVSYTLTDVESAAQDIVVEYSTDGGATYIGATEGAGSDGTVALTSSPGGTGHVFVWETATDLGPAFVTGASVRITTTDTKSGTDTSNTFDVDNNDAPVAFVTTPSGTPAGDVVISYTLTDTNGDTASIAVLYSTDSGTSFATATERPGLPSEGTSGLITSPVGINHIFVWDTVTDVGLGSYPNCVFRVTPQDTDIGTAADSGVFPVSNQTLLPIAAIDPVPRSFVDDVTVNYTLFDGDSDLADMAVEYSTDGGTTWGSCTDAGGASEGKTGLTTSPGGLPHTFVWDSATDLPAGAQAGITIRITPTDTDGTGTADTSNSFIRGNDVPSLTITAPAPASNQSGLIEFTYDLLDSTSDPVDLLAEYSTDAGATYNAATISVGETIDLTSSPTPGTPHNLAWNSIANLGIGNYAAVIFRLTPSDFPPPDGAANTLTIDVDNNDLPIVFIGSPSAGDLRDGNILVSYILIDGNSELISVTVEFSTDSGTTFANATLANSDQGTITANQISDLTSSPDGIGHEFDWLSGTDLASIDSDLVQVRITPSDPQNTGNPFVTLDFLVNNNLQPEAVAPTPGGVQVGNVLLTYTLIDSEADSVDIDVLFSTDGGQTFAVATEVAGPPSEGVTGLSASVAGTSHTFVWDTVTDAVAIAAAENDVILRVVPRDDPNLALGEGVTGQTDILTVDNTTAPTVTIAAVPSPQVGDATINYTLTDVEGAAQDIVVEYSTDGGLSYLGATEGAGSDGTTGLASSPGGTGHLFVWETATDLGPAFVTGADVRITTTDTKSGTGTSNTFDVDNNDAPVAFVTTPAGTPAGDVVISYTLTDTNGDTASITVQYSTDSGSSFATATERPGLPSEGTSGLITSPVGINHIFVWDTVTDVGLGSYPNCVFRVTPQDTDVGSAADSGVFPVSNQTLLPIAAIDPISRSFVDDVTVNYTLFDGDSDLADVAVEYSTDGGTTWGSCTDAGGASEGKTGLTTSPGGLPHTFVWDSATDLPGGAQAGITIRITPTDSDGTGTADTSNSFIRGNDVPTLTITAPAPSSSESGLIEFTYDLVDTTSDLVDLVAEYSTDAGATYNLATISVGETADLTSSPAPGTPHNLAWNSVANLGIGNYASVIFRLTPSDFPPPDGTADSVTINVDNNDLPIVFIGSPSAGDIRSNNILVSYILIDGNSELVSVTVEFSTDSGATFANATLANTDEGTISGSQISDLSSSPDGIGHEFDWLSGTDLVSTDSDLVQIRITPSDPQNTGNPFITQDFLVNNNLQPEAVVPTPGGVQVGNVTLDYTLLDVEGDLVDIDLLFSTDGGQTFANATEVTGPPSEGLTGLTAPPAGAQHTFVWDTVADSVAISAAENDVILRVIPRDNPNLALGQGFTGQTDILTVDNTVAPTVSISAIASPQVGDATINYTLTDVESAAQDIVVQFSTDGWISYLGATEGAGSDGTSGLTSSPGGTGHVFVWETATDLGPAFVTGVEVRITTTDTKSGTSTSNTFDIDNNAAPTALVTTPAGKPAGDVVISYTLTDTNGDKADITAEFSTDSGTTFAAATERPGLPSEGTGGLATSPTGENHVFVWDSVTDVGFGAYPNCVFRVTPQDTDVGSPADSGVFTLGNQTLLPSVAIGTVGRSFVDDVTVAYRLFDGDSDPSDIAVEFSTDSGGTWATCTDAGGASEGKTGLSASPAGDTHTFVWDSATDLPGGAQAGITIRITPTDSDGTGTADTSNPFIRGNDVPSVTITAPAPLSNQSGLIEVSYDLADSTSDPVDLIPQYSTDAGLTYNLATISVGETADLTSSPAPGTPHNLAWNSIVDLGVGNLTGVIFRLTPQDFPPPNGTPDSVTIDVSNNDLPIAFIGSPSGGDVRAGSVEVSYILIDGNSDAIDITCEVWDGISWLPATEDAVPPSEGTTGLTSSPGGEVHIFLWDSTAEFLDTDYADARFRITPDDGQNPGVAYTTALFRVNNNEEPEVKSIDPFTGDQVDNVSINYTLIDKESDTTTIAVGFSTDGGGTFNAATLANTDEGTISGNEISGLSTLPGGFTHSFDWVSGTDLAGVRETNVLLRIWPRDNPVLAIGLGGPALTAVFVVDNTTPPVVQNLANVGVSGVITLNYDLIDAESATIELTVEYSTDGGVNYNPALLTGSDEGVWSPGLITGLSSSPGGTPHWFTWDSVADIGSTDLNGVRLRATPMDTKIGTADMVTLNIANNDPPAVTIFAINGAQNGDVSITYKLVDSFSDDLDLVVTLWLGATGPFTPTEGVGSEGKVGLKSSPDGVAHIFVWDTMADLSTTYFTDVTIRMTPSDPFVSGAMDISNAFTVDNSIAANLVLGQDSFYDGAVDGRGMTYATALHYDGTNLYFADTANHRVLIFDAIPASDFQTADLVLGQPDMTLNLDNIGGISERTLYRPTGVYSDGTRLYVSERWNHRVLIWETIPTVNQAPADHVLGQVNFTSNGSASLQDRLSNPMSVFGGADYLYVSDGGNNRIMIWTIPVGPWTDGALADYVLGQINFTDNGPNQGGLSASSLDDPHGIFCDGATLFVADNDNHRVLQWDVPTLPAVWANGQAANRVLGQPLMTTNSFNSDDGSAPTCPPESVGFGRTRRTMYSPTGVFADAGKTYVADNFNNRVLVWNSAAPLTYACADYALGQPDGTSGTGNNGGISETSVYFPQAVTSTGTKLLIIDRANARVKIHNDVAALADNSPADVVWGQQDFFRRLSNHREVNGRALAGPAGLETDGTWLFVPTLSYARVLGWSALPNVNNKNADMLFGWDLFTDGSTWTGVAPDRLRQTCDAAYDAVGDRLFVADYGYHRVVVYPGPFTIGMAGTIFLGQPNGSTGIPGDAADEMKNPSSVSWNGTTLWVADQYNHRVLGFDKTNIVTGASADYLLGQSGYGAANVGPQHSGGGDPTGDRSFYYPTALDATATDLFVADRWNHRVLIWSLPVVGPIDDPAYRVIGRTVFTPPGFSGFDTTRSRMGFITGVHWDGASIFVTDNYNHRIMIWDSIPATNGPPADRMIGQPNFTSRDPNYEGVTERSLFLSGLTSFNQSATSESSSGVTRLWFPDMGNNRVLRYDVNP